MARPTLSIVTPSYNQSAYLEKTINSVLSQKYPALEYFVMDGGSTDGSEKIIRKYEDSLSGWVSEKDHGQAEAINKGFARCTGEIFGWINSDDFYLKGAFFSAVDFFDSHPDVDLVYGDVLSLDGNDKMINVMRFADYDLRDLMSFRIIGQPAVFFRRSAWETAGGLDLSYHYLLDHYLWLRIASRGKIAYSANPWAAARFYPEAKNRAHAADFGKEAFRLIEWMEKDPLLHGTYQQNARKVKGGAAWIDANYLSNGGIAGKSLTSYLQAFLQFPGRVWEDRRRVVLTMLMTFAPEKAAEIFNRKSESRLEQLKEYQNFLDQE
ncbi:MAG: glycosyltransferase family 2 protein [Flexilinea sp.]|jgi:glycosyltransferase involved in cell wall biosynthesis